MLYEKYSRMIDSLAWGCLKKLPEGYTTFEDIRQEALVVYARLIRKRFKVSKGTKFGTLLWKAITNHYSNILRDAYKPKNINAIYIPSEEFDRHQSSEFSPVDALIRKEYEEKILLKLKEIDQDIYDLVVNGPPEDLLMFVRKNARVSAYRRGCKKWNLRLTRKIIELYYDVNLESIIKQLHCEIPNKIKRISISEGLLELNE